MAHSMYQAAVSLVLCLACAGHRRQGREAQTGVVAADDYAGEVRDISKSPDHKTGRALAMMLLGTTAPAAFNLPYLQQHDATPSIRRLSSSAHPSLRNANNAALHPKMELLDGPSGRARQVRGGRQLRRLRQIRQTVDSGEINITRAQTYADIMDAGKVIDGVQFEPDPTFKCSVLFVAKQGMEVAGAVFLTPKVFDYSVEGFRPIESLQETPLKAPYEQIVFIGRKNFLAVHKDFRGLELGSKLMAAAESFVKELGAPEIFLEMPNTVGPKFYKAQFMHEKRGYVPIERRIGALSPYYNYSLRSKDSDSEFLCVCKRMQYKA